VLDSNPFSYVTSDGRPITAAKVKKNKKAPEIKPDNKPETPL